MKKNILLICPASFSEALWVTGNESSEVKTNAPSLAIVTLAGLTPPEFNVDIWDEIVHGVITEETCFEREYHLIGLTGYKAHFPRCRELATIFRNKMIPVAIGGPGVSATPDEYRDYFDILFIGEAERTWPRFLRDWQNDDYQKEYRQIESVDLAESPLPRWDLVAKDMDKYSMGSVQTTRGCPFDCEFCDVVYLFGRKPRHKPIDNVLEEVRCLQRIGFSSVFFCDDEFIGDPSYAKELLRKLIELNRSFAKPLTFSTQLTLRVSKDEELLELLADANFDVLFIGIETPNQESLRESNKLHNLSADMVSMVHKILSYGIIVRAGIIVGFDHDDSSIFDIQENFIQNSFIPSVAINMLKAPFGTKLWSRLRKENRVVYIPSDLRNKLGHPRSYTTIIPKQMSRIELMLGYRRLLDRVFSWQHFADRVCGFISLVRQSPTVHESTLIEDELEDLAKKLELDTDEINIVNGIINTAFQKTPFLLGRIKALIVQHAKYRESIVKLLPQLDRQIEMEREQKIIFLEDSRPVPVPEEFRKIYRTVFPDIYQRVSNGLRNKDRTPEALLAIFVNFLKQNREDFVEMTSKQHKALLESCNKIVATFNEDMDKKNVYVDKETQFTHSMILHLGDDILKNIQQVLVSMAVEKPQIVERNKSMNEAELHAYLTKRYDSLAFLPLVLEYNGQSDFLNFGYWDKETTDQKQASENLMEHLLAFIPQKKGTILDVACGKGATTAYLLNYYPAEQITGINISEKQLAIARKNAPGCHFQLMNATELLFPDNSIDTVVCVEAAFHFYTREKFLSEALRVLKPGGNLVLSDVLMTLDGHNARKGWTEKNFVPNPGAYRDLLESVGFETNKVVDVTEQCWKGHYWYAVRYFHQKFLARDIDQDCMQQILDGTYRRVKDIEYYLLVNARKGNK